MGRVPVGLDESILSPGRVAGRYLSTWMSASSPWAGVQAAPLPASLAPVVKCDAALWSRGPRAWWCPPPWVCCAPSPHTCACTLPCSLDAVGLVGPRVGGLVGLAGGISLTFHRELLGALPA